MIRHGVGVATPHHVTRSGPRGRVDPELVAAWNGFDARTGKVTLLTATRESAPAHTAVLAELVGR